MSIKDWEKTISACEEFKSTYFLPEVLNQEGAYVHIEFLDPSYILKEDEEDSDNVTFNEKSSLFNDIGNIDWEEFDASTYLEFEGLIISDDRNFEVAPNIFELDACTSESSLNFALSFQKECTLISLYSSRWKFQNSWVCIVYPESLE